MAVRAAIGADRWSIVRQLLIENLVLPIGGGLAGVFAGIAMMRLLARAGATELPALQSVGLDVQVFGYAALATIASGLFFGIGPAWRASRTDPYDALKESVHSALGAKKSRLLDAGIVVQVALTLVLLLGSALMIRSLRELLQQNPGFDPSRVQTIRLTHPTPVAQSRLTVFYDQLLEQLRGAAGLEAVDIISELPFSGMNDSSPFSIIGRPSNPARPALHANLHTIGGDYFKAMHIPVLAGRVFDDTDVKTSVPVALIDQALSTTFVAGENPIGQRINQGPDATRMMSDRIGDTVASLRLMSTLSVVFAGLALVLATVGLHAIIAYDVAQRLHEIGLRLV